MIECIAYEKRTDIIETVHIVLFIFVTKIYTLRRVSMSTLTIVLLVILVILIIALVALYFFGKKAQKKQEEQQAQIEAAKPVSYTHLDVYKRQA